MALKMFFEEYFERWYKNSEPANAHLKHNALIDFIAERTKSGKPTIGGITIGRKK